MNISTSNISKEWYTDNWWTCWTSDVK